MNSKNEIIANTYIKVTLNNYNILKCIKYILIKTKNNSVFIFINHRVPSHQVVINPRKKGDFKNKTRIF